MYFQTLYVGFCSFKRMHHILMCLCRYSCFLILLVTFELCLGGKHEGFLFMCISHVCHEQMTHAFTWQCQLKSETHKAQHETVCCTHTHKNPQNITTFTNWSCYLCIKQTTGYLIFGFHPNWPILVGNKILRLKKLNKGLSHVFSVLSIFPL